MPQARFPLLGASREHLMRELRVFPVGNYVIYYRPIDDGIQVLRILHGARQPEDLV